MTRLQSIENALSQLNPAAFQELCDSFLALRNEHYIAFLRAGSQSGKQQTIKGTPDAFILLPNNKYLKIEYSTNVSKGIIKINEDIDKCLDVSETKIKLEDIQQIIICTNFKVKPDEVQSLKVKVNQSNISFVLYSLDDLSLELHLEHRNLVHKYLGFPLDTGQIVSINQFIQEYDKASHRIATPLENPFQFRDKELDEISQKLDVNDFIIIAGSPGVGKTKLALKCIENFCSANIDYQAYCISYKNCDLIADLYTNLSNEKNYILFVDDVNRIDTFGQILGFYKSRTKGKLKIILTVRDYAYQKVKSSIYGYQFEVIKVDKFSDEQIIQIIKEEPFKILNSHFHNKIKNIADGNPRIGIMVAKLALESQNIDSLHDVSDLFERYYLSYMNDNPELEEVNNVKTLGLIAFFYAIPFRNREQTTTILNIFDITYDDFVESITKLEKLEFIDVFDTHVKVSEQNTATYYFYKVFIKDNLLSFDILLSNYFNSHEQRFRDCVIPANNTFGAEKVMNVLQPSLKKYWQSIETQQDEAFNFLNVFWFYLPSEALVFAYNLIETLPESSPVSYQLRYERNEFAFKHNNILELLSYYFRYYPNSKDSLELAFDLVRKCPEHSAELVHKIKESLIFDSEDNRSNYFFQNQLFEILIAGVRKNDLLLSQLFYELAKTFLQFKFHHTRSARKHSFSLYDFPIPNDSVIQDFRRGIWNVIDLNFNKKPNESFELLKNYAKMSSDVNTNIMTYDIQFIINIIDKHLDPKSFDHCRYVHDQIRLCVRNGVEYDDFNRLNSSFNCQLFEYYLKLDWNRLRDRESFEFDNLEEYEELKAAEIRGTFFLKNNNDVDQFIDNCVALKGEINFSFIRFHSLDLILDKTLQHNLELGLYLLHKLLTIADDTRLIPSLTFKTHLKSLEKAIFIWDIIHSFSFSLISHWELIYFNETDDALLDDELVARELIEKVRYAIEHLEGEVRPYFNSLNRYFQIDTNLCHNLMSKIYSKNLEGNKIIVWDNFIEANIPFLNDDLDLILNTYLQQFKLNELFDHHKSLLLSILNRDVSFLIKFVNSIELDFNSDKMELNSIWAIDDIESILFEVFDSIIARTLYLGIGSHFCNAFFYNINVEYKDRAKLFLFTYCHNNFCDVTKMNLIVDIVRHSMREYFDELLLHYLKLNQNKDSFSSIWWRGNGGTAYSGDVNFGDIEAAEWKNIQRIVNQSEIGISLLPIKKYLDDKINYALQYANTERTRKFISQY
jgi:hypothetical protein